jgi:hypothetical protein
MKSENSLLILLRYTKNSRGKLESKRKVVEKKENCKENKHLGLLQKFLAFRL